jgi:uncharacterized protein (TIGR00297 family)
MDILTVIEAFLACGILGVISFRFRFVDDSGLAAAFLIGILIFVLPPDGWKWFIVVLIFHGVAAQFTRYKYAMKRRIGFAQEKGGARAWQNIVANGGIAALFAVGEGLWHSNLLTLGFVGAVSTATADTLATEVGLLSRSQPRLITDFRRRVTPGTSGGVSPMGELATLLGAIIIGLSACFLGLGNLNGYCLTRILFVAVISGFVGCTVDSLIGATVQGMFRCEECSNITENKKHCGIATIPIRGSRLIDNNMVNFIATATGAIFAVAMFLFLWS